MAQVHQAMKNIDLVAKQNIAAILQIEQAAQDLNGLSSQLTRLTGSNGWSHLDALRPSIGPSRMRPISDAKWPSDRELDEQGHLVGMIAASEPHPESDKNLSRAARREQRGGTTWTKTNSFTN
jgi:hypothetical protein